MLTSLDSKANSDKPIFTLNMFFNKAYIVSSTELMQAVQRNHKTLSFEPLLTFSASNMAGIKSKKTINLLREEASGGEGLNQKIMHAMYPKLIGEPLDRMNLRMIRLLRASLDQLGESSTVDLYRWCRDAITAASTDATYGPLNPYSDKEVSEAFWCVHYDYRQQDRLY